VSLRVAIVVLNWNNAPDTLACLESLSGVDYPNCGTLVVDNGSSDDSVARIRAVFPEVEVLETRANLGYAGGNNFGVRCALAREADAILILNNDVTVEPGFLAPLADVLATLPGCGVTTPLVGERGVDERVWALGAAIDGRTAAVSRMHASEAVAGWRGRAAFEVDAAAGAAMLIKREVFERAGLIDEAYFLYYEEVDWSIAVRRAGYQILAVPGSVVWHKTSSTLGQTSPVIDYYMLRNHLLFIGRHWRGGHRAVLTARTMLRGLAAIAACTVKPNEGRRLPSRNARLLALRDGALGRTGPMPAGRARKAG
jgi:GT2 family glycosyltransferase